MELPRPGAIENKVQRPRRVLPCDDDRSVQYFVRILRGSIYSFVLCLCICKSPGSHGCKVQPVPDQIRDVRARPILLLEKKFGSRAPPHTPRSRATCCKLEQMEEAGQFLCSCAFLGGFEKPFRWTQRAVCIRYSCSWTSRREFFHRHDSSPDMVVGSQHSHTRPLPRQQAPLPVPSAPGPFHVVPAFNSHF
ncbi:hypothetical protein BJV74DRAFT_187968 [Russula compacta]|nr:hypothetical protein BJV74DRAFT_187968 [Russula compacta]